MRTKALLKRCLRTRTSKRLMCFALGPLRPLIRRGHLGYLKVIPVAGNFSIPMPGGRTLRLINNDDTGLYYDGFPDGYEPELMLPWFLYSWGSRTILDIGANVGLYSLLAALASPEADIYAFEPVDPCLRDLAKNIRANNISNIAVVRGAVSDETGSGTLYVPHHVLRGKLSGVGTLSPIAMNQPCTAVSCPQIRIDDFVKAHGLRPELIKVDVEGCNARVLRGMVQMLSEHDPILCIEFLPVEDTGLPRTITDDRRNDVADAEHLLDQAGYGYKYLATIDGLSERPNLRDNTDLRWWNWCLTKQPIPAEFGSRSAMRKLLNGRLRPLG